MYNREVVSRADVRVDQAACLEEHAELPDQRVSFWNRCMQPQHMSPILQHGVLDCTLCTVDVQALEMLVALTPSRQQL